MQIVETTVRPFRLAIAFSTVASRRVARRSFRLVGGRWGGYFDVLLCIDADAGLDDFARQALALADPDLVLVIDPVLDGFKWDPVFEQIHRQPFDVIRLRERMERSDFRWLFRESATVPEEDQPPSRVIDLDKADTPWLIAAAGGFPASDTEAERVSFTTDVQGEPLPAFRSRVHLSGPVGARVWAVVGDSNDLHLASQFWTLRALGGRPIWVSDGLMGGPAGALARIRPPRVPPCPRL